jgi:hypothetical protein
MHTSVGSDCSPCSGRSPSNDSAREMPGFGLEVSNFALLGATSPRRPQGPRAGSGSEDLGETVRQYAPAAPRTGERAPCNLERVRLGEGSQLLQRLLLDLADTLARDVERAPDLLERARMLAVEPVAKLQHAALTMRQRREDLLQRLLAHRDRGGARRRRSRHHGESATKSSF